MILLDVLLQHGVYGLDRPFTYAYRGDKAPLPGARVLVPFHHTRIVGFIERVYDTELTLEEVGKERGFPLSYAESLIDEKPLLDEELLRLASEMVAHYLSPRIDVLIAMLPPSLKPTLGGLKGPKIAYEDFLVPLDVIEDGLTPKQIEILRLVAKNGEIRKKEAGSPSVVKKLLEAKKLGIRKKEKARFVLPEYEKEQPHPLNFEQQKAFDDILSCPKDVVLLQGVTGSGKTEVYLHLSEHYLEQGKNILMLVPEISLTPVMVEYFSRRFGEKIAILHSGLTPAEKYDEYRRIAEGKARIVVGARSAVFAPLKDIGLIILDEEHVDSYKQDSAPFYHAREVAIFRARHFGAKVVLGSATPSLETKARAQKGVYGFALMARRVNDAPLPPVRIVDLRDRSIMMKNDSVFSKTLVDAIKERLEKKEQVMLLLNRRGYSSFTRCASCGREFVCPSCKGNLTYHKEDGLLKCHHCGHVELYPETCPDCGSKDIQRIGFGTERAVKVLQEYFPEARIARLDSDVSKVRAAMEKTLKAFKAGEFDILVGTQMIAKGHDFPRVTLVGVLLADQGLLVPSYRASENVFELLAQAVGRSGRASLPGIALIQTYNPAHYAITLGAKQDYEGFYRRELQERHLAKYPPFTYLATLLFSSKDEERAVESAIDFRSLILEQRFAGVDAVGPMTPYYARLGDYYRRTVLVRFRSPDEIKPYLSRLLSTYSGKGGVDIAIDVDPLES